jgi:hypothetical protein
MRPPINPHAFDEHKLGVELAQRNIELLSEHWSETRKRVDTMAKTVFLLSGGALTVSLGVFIRQDAPVLTAFQSSVLSCSWWSLFGSMVGFALILGILIIQASLQGSIWGAEFAGRKPTFSVKWVTATEWLNWLLGVSAFALFVIGLGALAWLASQIVRH